MLWYWAWTFWSATVQYHRTLDYLL